MLHKPIFIYRSPRRTTPDDSLYGLKAPSKSKIVVVDRRTSLNNPGTSFINHSTDMFFLRNLIDLSSGIFDDDV